MTRLLARLVIFNHIKDKTVGRKAHVCLVSALYFGKVIAVTVGCRQRSIVDAVEHRHGKAGIAVAKCINLLQFLIAPSAASEKRNSN
ncbi:MAG: hypothetical protein K2G77_08210 [Muribaculaceae bacterium]|nr:hypothetical protein [Muribaculaceae bacterium]